MAKIVLVLISLFVYQFSITVDAELKYVSTLCDDSKLNYTVDSSYKQNLDFVFDKLITSSTDHKFNNHTIGDAPDKVYGLYQCRYDLNNRTCSECVKEATRIIVEKCPSAGEAIIYYDECTLRYSNRSIFSLPETLKSYYTQSSIEVSNYTVFASILASEMERLIENASSSFPHFAYRQANVTSEFDKLYSFAQCTADLDASDCNDCLKTALPKLPTCCNFTASTGAWAFLPSCLLWYYDEPFLKDPPFSPSPSTTPKGSEPSKTTSLSPGIIGAIGGSISVGLLFLLVVIGICFCRKGPKERSSDEGPRSQLDEVKSDVEGLGDTEFERYKFKTLKIATRDFADENMLGEGGFGIVYKGTHTNGQTLAIKRLSGGNSGQGKKEFMTEARLLAKLQHRNLVKLLGFCSERDEKLLVYEFMPNSSLDGFLFDPTKRSLLDWAARSNIIIGIAKGLQYLHEDSRLTIIHRDLKPENILLDKFMNPKIADFGLAKLFDGDEKFGNTLRIAGTRGYMAPEYLRVGDYSDKTDVYSFGIMLLEIVCGQKSKINRQIPQEDFSIQAWRLWKEKRSFEIVDPLLLGNCADNEVIRCIQIGLLCVQANAKERPTMTEVVLMLTSSIDLRTPFPSIPIITLNQKNIPMNYSSGQQSDVDRSSTKSTTMTSDVTDEPYSIPIQDDW